MHVALRTTLWITMQSQWIKPPPCPPPAGEGRFCEAGVWKAGGAASLGHARCRRPAGRAWGREESHHGWLCKPDQNKRWHGIHLPERPGRGGRGLRARREHGCELECRIMFYYDDFSNLLYNHSYVYFENYIFSNSTLGFLGWTSCLTKIHFVIDIWWAYWNGFCSFFLSMSCSSQ